MHEVDGVKAYTASDPSDVLPTAFTFIVVMCEDQNQKERNRYLRLKNELNRTEFEKSKPTQP